MSLEKPSCQEEENYIRDYYSESSSYESEDNYNDYDGCESDGCDAVTALSHLHTLISVSMSVILLSRCSVTVTI